MSSARAGSKDRMFVPARSKRKARQSAQTEGRIEARSRALVYNSESDSDADEGFGQNDCYGTSMSTGGSSCANLEEVNNRGEDEGPSKDTHEESSTGISSSIASTPRQAPYAITSPADDAEGQVHGPSPAQPLRKAIKSVDGYGNCSLAEAPPSPISSDKREQREDSRLWELSSSSAEGASSLHRYDARDQGLACAHLLPQSIHEDSGLIVTRPQTNSKATDNGSDHEEEPALDQASSLQEKCALHTAGVRVEHMEGQCSTERLHRAERRGLDVDFMIAAVAAMTALSVPERHRWMVWLLCHATVILVPAQRWGFLEGVLGAAARLYGRLHRRRADVRRKEIKNSHGIDGIDCNTYGDAGLCASDSTAEARRDASGREKPHPQWRRHGVIDSKGAASERITDGGHESRYSTRADEGNEEAFATGKMSTGELAEESQQSSEEDLRQQVLASMGSVEVHFLNSEGVEERDRLLQQCLEYANGDVSGAIAVCSAFCRFRLAEGWPLVLKASELRRPLNTRAHILTEGLDKHGRAMLVFSPGALEMSESPPAAYHQAACFILQEVLKERAVQRKGFVLLVDARGVGLSLLRHFQMSDYKRGMRMFSGAFPVKIKAIWILHVNRAISLALSIAQPMMSNKMRSRLQKVSSKRAADGSFVAQLADPEVVPVELDIQGTWTNSATFWSDWVHQVVGPSS